MNDKKVILVTGGSSGIGKSTVTALAVQGCHVIINYNKSRHNAEELSHDLNDRGFSTETFQADISNVNEVTSLAKFIGVTHERLDGVVNNSGVVHEGLFLLTNEDIFWDVYKTNVGGVLNVCKSMLSLMMQNKYGRIVNVVSTAALHSTYGLSAYASSKAAIISLTKVIAREMAGFGITVNAVAPGYTESRMTEEMNQEVLKKITGNQPVKRLGHPDEIANVIKYLILDSPDYMTGEVIRVDGGSAI